MEEHVSRLKESTYNSEGVKRQRHQDQNEMRLYSARLGRAMLASDFLLKLQKMVPNIHIKEGGIAGDLALYLTEELPQGKWKGKNYKYMGWITFGLMPEYSLYEFNEKLDVMIRATDKGWRDVLLAFIKDKVITEEQCDKIFGKPLGRGANSWFKKLKDYRENDQTLLPSAPEMFTN
jgi:hypothetical protein